jgi:uncharacterized membrane protein (UPF0127 family)
LSDDVYMSLRRSMIGPVAVLAMVALAGSCGGPARSPANLPLGELRIFTAGSEVTLHVEIAETPETQTVGLMHRRRLEPDAGMAFLFTRPTMTAFWMKDTLIPLSIAFWDSSGRIVATFDMDPCQRDRCPVYTPGALYIGAVEANRGFFRAHGVTVGTRVELDR